MLDGNILAPRKAFPESYNETEADPAPVLALQPNFFQGGVLLDCAPQHNFVDMCGIEQCYTLLAAAMNDERFSPDICSSSWARLQLYKTKRPNFGPLKSDIYFMSQTESGDIDALLYSNEEDLNRLEADAKWNEYADYIG
ncbi:hypothetical protein BDR22DRAFT_893792 [Usnea florida]